MTRFSITALLAPVVFMSNLGLGPAYGLAYGEEPLRWTFYPGDGAGAAVLSNCSECDYTEVTVSCEQGTGEIQVAVAINVPEGKPDEERNLSFLFGEGEISAPATFYANELEGTIEPIAIIAPDHPLLAELETYVAVPDIAVSDEEKKRVAENSSFEVLVENGPNKVFPLKGADVAIKELRAFCAE